MMEIRNRPSLCPLFSFTDRYLGTAVLTLLFTMTILIPIGCDENSSRVSPVAPPPPPQREAQWRIDEVNGERSARLAVDSETVREQLADAIEQAQRTANQAREQWRQTPESQKHRWAVKWASPVAHDDQAVEHVWVRPLHWSPFRIEGVLLNEPDRPLDAPGQPPSQGDLVGFPAEELSDWVRWHNDEADGQRDGGFTIDVLERAAGKVQ